MSGEKTQEVREIKTTTATKYCTINAQGQTTGLIKYDVIRFFVGYNTNRETALVEVRDAFVEEIVDENDNLVFYEQDGQQQQLINVVYEYGKIIEK